MMYTKFLILIFVLQSLCFIKAQSHRFYYEYKFAPDSTKTDSIISELTRLEIFKDHSEFVSELSALRDSALIVSAAKKSGFVGTDLPNGHYENKVWKSKDKLYSLEFIGIEPYKVINDINLEWKLNDEQKTIQNYPCQKATINYGNRIWEAWFTKEIPIQDGPYVFRNLPGLIVQLSDQRNHHRFTLIGNKKTSNNQTNISDKRMFRAVEVNRKQFKKKWKEFRQNPIGYSEQFLLMNPHIFNYKLFDKDGKERDMNEVKKEERKQAITKMENENNYLDLALYN